MFSEGLHYTKIYYSCLGVWVRVSTQGVDGFLKLTSDLDL